MEKVNKRHFLDLAAIFREYGDAFLEKHKLCADQVKAYNAICNCRTTTLGGHVDRCDQCGYQQISYNSCRNRHCNKCQYTKQLIWVDKLKSTLPVCRYFHMVFTIPSQLHKTFYINQQECYKMLFKATAETLRKVANNPKFLGAQTGAVSVLHTWGQSLTYHPHIHMLVPAGVYIPLEKCTIFHLKSIPLKKSDKRKKKTFISNDKYVYKTRNNTEVP
ncbi:MAG: transposase zinc-binding domain-containing protein, partial [Cyclobacteriaceae bacterium]